MRRQTSLLLVLLGLTAASTVGCHHRGDRSESHFGGSFDMTGSHPSADQDPSQDPQAAPAPVADSEPAAAVAEPAPEPTTPAPEIAAAPPEEVSLATEPPEPVYEEPTTQPAPEAIWVAGYWQPEGQSWTWYTGQWRTAPAGHIYVQPYYERVGTRVVYVRGYWHAGPVESRSYGGSRIVFVKPSRPADYQPTYHHSIHNVPGLAAGARTEPTYRPAAITHHPMVAMNTPPEHSARRHDSQPGAMSPPPPAHAFAPPTHAPAPAPQLAPAPTHALAPAPARIASAAPSPPARAPSPAHVAPPAPAPRPALAAPRAVAATPPPAPAPHAAPPPAKRKKS